MPDFPFRVLVARPSQTGCVVVYINGDNRCCLHDMGLEGQTEAGVFTVVGRIIFLTG